VLPTAALLALNGLYTGAAHRAGEELFWSLDVLQFVLVPLASVWALARFGGLRPCDYGLGPIAGRQPRARGGLRRRLADHHAGAP
jgi:hypothetical protein